MPDGDFAYKVQRAGLTHVKVRNKNLDAALLCPIPAMRDDYAKLIAREQIEFFKNQGLDQPLTPSEVAAAIRERIPAIPDVTRWSTLERYLAVALTLSVQQLQALSF